MTSFKIVFDHLAKSAGSSARFFFTDAVSEGKVSPQLSGNVINHLHLFEQFDILQGHFYGRILYKIHPGIQFVTVLRHPVERFLSYYSYVRSSSEHHHHQLGQQLTIDEFVRNKSDSVLFMLFNNATTHFAAAMGERLPMKRLLSEAKKNLEKYEVIGITENMPAFFENCCRKFGWPLPRHSYMENVTVDRISSEKVPAETLNIIESFNLLDLELYNFARNLIEYRGGAVNTSPLIFPLEDQDDNLTVDRPGVQVDLLEANGQPNDKVFLRSGEKLTVRFVMRSESVSDDAITVVFGLRNDSPEPLFASSSQLLGHYPEINPGDRRIMTLDCLVPLAAGRYFLEICVMQRLSSAAGRLIYFRDKKFVSIIVSSPATYQFSGPINLCPNLILE
jgi:hypothetical protein